MSILIARACERFPLLPQYPAEMPHAAFWGSEIFSRVRVHAASYRSIACLVFSILALVSIVAYVISMNIILFEGSRAASLERVLHEERVDTQALLAERAAFQSPTAVKARAEKMGMIEIGQVLFVSDEAAVAAR